MSYLLLPEDEKELVLHLCGTLGLSLLLSDIAPDGVPEVAEDPIAALPEELPEQPRFGGEAVIDFIFWCSAAGPVRTLADAEEPSEPVDRVAQLLTRESAGDQYDVVIDLTRTPVLRYHRCRWQTSDRLIPGVLQAMPVRIRDHPKDVLRLHRSAESWLRKRGPKINPFEHCSETPVPQPRNLNPFWVWVQPYALEWMHRGGEVWPWTA